jgi:hypothetical protein
MRDEDIIRIVEVIYPLIKGHVEQIQALIPEYFKKYKVTEQVWATGRIVQKKQCMKLSKHIWRWMKKLEPQTPETIKQVDKLLSMVSNKNNMGFLETNYEIYLGTRGH